MRTTRPARHDFSLDLVRALRVLTLAALVMALALGCGSESEDPVAPGPQGCPSGSVPWTDGSCMPVGIQGCADIFIEEDGLCHPRMAKCPAGTIPRFDEGCVPVGIQGCAEMFMEEDGLCHPSITKCPAGTIPKFDEGCVPVGIQGCAEVFMEDDGLCHPTMEKCPAGTFAVPQEGCVPIDGPDGCGTGTWGNLQEVAGVTTIWVDPSVAASGNGTMASPVKTIAEAMAMVPVGGRVTLGAGTYDEAIYIDRMVTIEGRCPSMVRVQGTEFVDSFVYAVGVNSADSVTLRGLEIGGPGIGVLAYNATDLKIERVRVRSATTYGMLFQASTEASIVRSLIDGTQAGSDEAAGHGVHLVYGPRVTLAESAIVANHAVGLFISFAGTEVTVTGSLVEGTLPRASTGSSGRGIDVGTGARLTVANSAVVLNHEVGVTAAGDGTALMLSDSLIEGTLPVGGTTAIGFGVNAQLRAAVTLLGTAVLGNQAAGIRAHGTGTEVTITGSLVKDTLPVQSAGETKAEGLNINNGARVTLSDSAIVANQGAGLAVFSDGTEVMASGTLVEGQSEAGVSIDLGALLTLDRSALIKNGFVGVQSSEIGSELRATASLIADTLPRTGDGIGGLGVLVTSGARATLGASAIVDNLYAGLAVQAAVTEVAATGNLIARTRFREIDGMMGRGVNTLEGATLVLEANAIVENHEVGLLVSDGSVLTARGNLVEGTLEAPGDPVSQGVAIQRGSQATLESNAIVDNRDVGLKIVDATLAGPILMELTHVSATDNIIEGTLPKESDGQSGLGVLCSSAAGLQLASSVLLDNHVAALQVVSATATVSRSFIDTVAAGSFTLINPTRSFEGVGDGLMATVGSTLDINDIRIQGCVRAGVLFDNSTGTLANVVSTDNQFGLVLQGERRPTYESGNNQFTSNTGQDILLGGDLPVPDAPSPIPPAPAPSP